MRMARRVPVLNDRSCHSELFRRFLGSVRERLNDGVIDVRDHQALYIILALRLERLFQERAKLYFVIVGDH